MAPKEILLYTFINQRQILDRFTFTYKIELKLYLFLTNYKCSFCTKITKALTPLCWKDRVGWQKWLTFVQKEFNMHNNDNVLEFAPDKINKAFKNYLHLCILLVWYYHRIFPPSLFKILLMPWYFVTKIVLTYCEKKLF